MAGNEKEMGAGQGATGEPELVADIETMPGTVNFANGSATISVTIPDDTPTPTNIDMYAASNDPEPRNNTPDIAHQDTRSSNGAMNNTRTAVVTNGQDYTVQVVYTSGPGPRKVFSKTIPGADTRPGNNETIVLTRR